jgi:5-methylcytosine-specific restriction endonuclease McrA
MQYTCAVCQQKVDGDLIIYQEHTDKHIIDLVKHDHPEWAEKDGMCRKCFEYYQSEINATIFKDAPCALRNRKIRGFWNSLGNMFKAK